MRKVVLLFVAATLVVAVPATLWAAGTLDGSKHDLIDGASTKYRFTGITLCEPCHVPHNPPYSGVGAPLWNHKLATAANFTLYNTGYTLHNESLICLGCHDGLTGVDVFGSDTTADVVMASSEQYYIGTDLSNDHPVGAACPSGNTEYNCSPTNVDLYTYNSSKYVECSSCHDPHDTTNGSFLKQAKASICQECHNK